MSVQSKAQILEDLKQKHAKFEEREGFRSSLDISSGEARLKVSRYDPQKGWVRYDEQLYGFL